MDTIQPPPIPAQEQESKEVQSVANQPKHSDARVALSVTEKRKNRGVTPKGWRHKGPAKWAEAMKLFVGGELGTWQAVADHLGVDYRTVARKAAKEDWLGLRKAQVQRLMDMVKSGEGLSIERKEKDAESLAQVQAEVAASLLAHAKTMQAQANAVSTSVQVVSDRLALARDTDTDSISRRLLALSQVHETLVDSIRVLAGIPHPDKGPGRYRNEPKEKAEEPSKPVTDISKVGMALSDTDAHS